MKLVSQVLRGLLTGIFSLFLFFMACNAWVIMTTSDRVFTDISDVPEVKVALVLGTSKKFANGMPNAYFEHRMDAAAKLFKSGKVKQLLLSGDNRTPYYNEPADMQKALEKRGVPAEAISADKAGLRTLDSVVRSNQVFGEQEIIVVTQRFHSYRAVFIGNHNKIDTYAFAAESLPFRSSSRLLLREFFARPMAVIDLYVLNRQPSETGKEDVIPY